MNKYKKLLFFLLLVLVIISLIISNTNIYKNICIEKFTQKNSIEVDSFNLELNPLQKNNINSILSSNLENLNQENISNNNKELLLDTNFAKEYPELYEKILKIVFKDYIESPEDIQYTLTISNKSNDNYLSTNLLSSISKLDPIELHKIKLAIEEQGIPEGNCNSAYPHPSYSTLNNFNKLSTCDSECEKKDKNGLCPPVAFNCLTQDK